jgi:trimeric autotransporter adhesin
MGRGYMRQIVGPKAWRSFIFLGLMAALSLVLASPSQAQCALTGTNEYTCDFGGNVYPGIDFNLSAALKLIVNGDVVVLTNGSGNAGIRIVANSNNFELIVESGASITAKGSGSHGIWIEDASQATVKTEGTIAVGTGIGIYIDDTTGNVLVDASGTITSARSSGIVVSDTTGRVTVNALGTITSEDGRDFTAHGIYVLDAGLGADITISGAVSGGRGTDAGIKIESTTAASTLEISSGGTLGALSDIAASDGDDALTISNYGSITGIVELGAGDDVFNNNSGGTWYLRYGDDTATADFGDDNDVFTNNGTLSLLKGTQTNWQGALINVETFTNSGIIDLSDGIAGDELSIAGEYQSDGGSLYLDAVLDDGAIPQTDLLDLETVTMPNDDPTRVYVTNIGGLGGVTAGNGIQIIEADTSAPGAFVLGERVRSGAYEYELVEVSADWYLSSFIIDETGEYPALVSGALSSWHADLGFLHDRIKAVTSRRRAPVEPAGYSSADGSAGFWVSGLAVSQSADTGIAYDQTVTRFEGGIDKAIEVADYGRLAYGVFGGFGNNAQGFEDSSSEAESDIGLGGAYAGYRHGALYSEAVAKYEHHWASFSGDSTDGEDSPFDVDVIGASLEAGVRFAAASFAAVPRVRMSYARALAGSFEDASGAEVGLADSESLRGKAALRFDNNLWDGGTLGIASLEAGVRHEFLGEQEAEVSGLTFTHELPGDVFFAAFNLDIVLLEDAMALSLRAEYAKGEEAEEYGASLSLKLEL